MGKTKTIQLFLLSEALSFVSAGLVHFGLLMKGYEHLKAGIAESVIGIVLLLGLLLIRFRTTWAPIVGVVTQAFALFGTGIGLFTVAVGIGPQTIPDIVYHIVILAFLTYGLVAASKNMDSRVNLMI